MRKVLLVLMLALFGAGAANARITVTVPAEWEGRKIPFKATEIRSMVEAKSPADLVTRTNTLTIRSETFSLEPVFPNASCYRFLTYETPRGYHEIIFTFYAVPADELAVTLSDAQCSAVGTPLMEQVSEIQNLVRDSERRHRRALEKEDTEAARETAVRLFADLKKRIPTHSDRIGAPYAVMEFIGAEDIVEYGSKLTGEALASMIYPLAQSKMADAEKRLAKRAKQRTLESAAKPAPDFTLPDMQGKRVALSGFRGKWVVLDFWGSWCGWCIKGFSELKEAYAKYDGKLEIVGIDCNDSPEAWKAAVERYELPWVRNSTTRNQTTSRNFMPCRTFPPKSSSTPMAASERFAAGMQRSFSVIWKNGRRPDNTVPRSADSCFGWRYY